MPFNRMGFEVVAVGRGAKTADLAGTLGAHHYVDGSAQDIGEALQALGGATLVVVTASGGKTASQAIKGLRPRGRVVVLGASDEPVEASTSDLLFGGRSVEGALTGDPATGDATLKFSLLAGVSAMVETMPLARAAEAYARMMAGDARFRIVLTMADALPG